MHLLPTICERISFKFLSPCKQGQGFVFSDNRITESFWHLKQTTALVSSYPQQIQLFIFDADATDLGLDFKQKQDD